MHLYGQMAEVTGLAGRLPDHVRVVEDAAQCQGATRDGRSPGSGGIAATSFYPGKNLGAYGDAGAVLTDDEELAGLVRAIANHGGVAKYRHDVPGFNSRLDGLQAVVLRAKLARLADGNAARRAAAARYDTLLADLASAGRVVLPTTDVGNVHVWHLYVVQVAGADRDDIVGKLNAEGIGAGVPLPRPRPSHRGVPASRPRPRRLPPRREGGGPDPVAAALPPDKPRSAATRRGHARQGARKLIGPHSHAPHRLQGRPCTVHSTAERYT